MTKGSLGEDNCIRQTLYDPKTELLCICDEGYCKTTNGTCIPQEASQIDRYAFLCGPHSSVNPQYRMKETRNASCLCDPGYTRYHRNCILETSAAVFEEKSVKLCGLNEYWDEVEDHYSCDYSKGEPESVYTKEMTAGCFCLPKLCRNSSGCFDVST